MKSPLYNADIHAALIGFNKETVLYCGAISDAVAQDYAMTYSRMLRNRAKGLEGERVAVPAQFPTPNRKLIEAELETTYRKWFAS